MAANPTGVLASQSGSNYITLSWNSVPAVQGYRIRHRILGTDGWEYISPVSSSTTSYDIFGLLAFHTHQFQVRSIPANNWPSTFVNLQVNYSVPTPTLVGKGVLGGVRISWTVADANYIDYYQIEKRRTMPVGTFVLIEDNYIPTLYLDTNTEFDIAYDYRVVAVNIGDNYSNSVSKTLKGLKAKYQLPKLTFLSTSSVFSGASITLNWQQPDSMIIGNTDRYSIYRDGALLDDNISNSSVSYTDTGLNENQQYEYTLIARGTKIYVDSAPSHWQTCPVIQLASALDGTIPFVLGSESLTSDNIPASAAPPTSVPYTNPQQYRYIAPPTPLPPPQPIIALESWNNICDNLIAIGGDTDRLALRGTLKDIFGATASGVLMECTGFVTTAWDEIGENTYMFAHKITNHLYYVEMSLVKNIESEPTFLKEIICLLPSGATPNKNLYFTLPDFYSNNALFSFKGNEVRIMQDIFPPFRLHKTGLVWGNIN